jgi:hypothetical protein
MNKISLEERNGMIRIVGGVCALVVALLAVSEIGITFLPDGGADGKIAGTIVEWFSLYARNPLMGMRNLGLVNLLMMAVSIPLVLTLYLLHSEKQKSLALLAFAISLAGTVIYFANNRAFAMLSLSTAYAQAGSEMQRAALIGAGEALLAAGKSHTAGTYLGFFVGGLGSLLMNAMMLRGKLFGRLIPLVGIAGYGILLAYDSVVSFVPSLFGPMMFFAGIGGLLTIVWDVTIGLKLFTMGNNA